MAQAMATVPVASAALGAVAGLPAARLVASHFSVMTEASQILVAGPAVVERALDQRLDKEALGGPDVHAKNGVVDNLVEDEAAAFDEIRRFLSYLPPNCPTKWDHLTIWQSENTLFRNGLLVVLGSLGLWISAKIQVPFYPVPMTMQTFFVLSVGMAFGWRLGGATILLYLAEGAAGLPVFAGTPEKGIGFAYMAGPTAGYLLGFVLAASTVGWLAEKGWDRNFLTTALAMLIGNAIIYVPGLLWLGSVLGWDKPILAWGLTPFIFGDLTKLVLAAVVLPMAWHFIKRNSKFRNRGCL